MDKKQFKQAVWQVRVDTKRKYLTKKQLAEAYMRMIEAEKNKIKLKRLIDETA